MKLTTKELLSLQIELMKGYSHEGKELLKPLLLQKVKPSVKVKLSRLAEAVNKEVELYEKARKDVFEQYGEKIVENDVEQIKIKEENIEVAEKELTDLLTSEIDLDIKKLLFGMSEESLDTIDDDSYYPVMYKILANEK